MHFQVTEAGRLLSCCVSDSVCMYLYLYLFLVSIHGNRHNPARPSKPVRLFLICVSSYAAARFVGNEIDQ